MEKAKKKTVLDFDAAKQKLRPETETISFTLNEEIAAKLDEMIDKYFIDDMTDLALLMALAQQFDPHIYDDL